MFLCSYNIGTKFEISNRDVTYHLLKLMRPDLQDKVDEERTQTNNIYFVKKNKGFCD
jgi:hypothetical protein